MRTQAALPARAVLALQKAGKLELVGLLALVVLRSADAAWSSTQRQAASELGVAERTLRRQEQGLVELGLVEVTPLAAGRRRLRVLHRVLHNFSTPDTGVRSDRTWMSGRFEDNGTHARADSALPKEVQSYLHVRAGARARSPVLSPVRPVLERIAGTALEELAAVAGLWGNVLPEARSLAARISKAWGDEAFVSYAAKLGRHLGGFEEERRGGMALGSLRARAAQIGGGRG